MQTLSVPLRISPFKGDLFEFGVFHIINHLLLCAPTKERRQEQTGSGAIGLNCTSFPKLLNFSLDTLSAV